MADCISCEAGSTSLFRGDDGHHRKRCDSCGHVGGPYVAAGQTDQVDLDNHHEPDSGSNGDSDEPTVNADLGRWV